MAASKEEERKRIGRVIRREREQAGLSVRELARRIAGSNNRKFETWRHYLIRWENGHNKPDESNRAAIADALGIPRSRLIADAGDDVYDVLLRSLRTVVAHEVEGLREMVEELAVVDVERRFADAIGYVHGRVLIARDALVQGKRREALRHIRRAEQRLAEAIDEMKAAA